MSGFSADKNFRNGFGSEFLLHRLTVTSFKLGPAGGADRIATTDVTMSGMNRPPVRSRLPAASAKTHIELFARTAQVKQTSATTVTTGVISAAIIKLGTVSLAQISRANRAVIAVAIFPRIRDLGLAFRSVATTFAEGWDAFGYGAGS